MTETAKKTPVMAPEQIDFMTKLVMEAEVIATLRGVPVHQAFREMMEMANHWLKVVAEIQNPDGSPVVNLGALATRGVQ